MSGELTDTLADNTDEATRSLSGDISGNIRIYTWTLVKAPNRGAETTVFLNPSLTSKELITVKLSAIRTQVDNKRKLNTVRTELKNE